MVTMAFEYLGELRTRARHEPSAKTVNWVSQVGNRGTDGLSR
jgi:hypothetical protein